MKGENVSNEFASIPYSQASWIPHLEVRDHSVLEALYRHSGVPENAYDFLGNSMPVLLCPSMPDGRVVIVNGPGDIVVFDVEKQEEGQ